MLRLLMICIIGVVVGTASASAQTSSGKTCPVLTSTDKLIEIEVMNAVDDATCDTAKVSKITDNYLGVRCERNGDQMKCSPFAPAGDVAQPEDIHNCVKFDDVENTKPILKGTIWQSSTDCTSVPVGKVHRLVNTNSETFASELCFEPGNACIEITDLDEEGFVRLGEMGASSIVEFLLNPEEQHGQPI